MSIAVRESPVWTHHHATVSAVRLHYVEMGSGPLVILLHGFPEFWYSWRRQLPALAAAGFRVLAPDLRGYNDSDRPAGVASYRLDLLAGDVLGLIRHAGEQRAAVVGHDWGGVIAWHLAIHRPEALTRLAILNAPHPGAMQRELRSVDQLRRSWYIFFFQLPYLPEKLLQAGNCAWLGRLLRTQPVQAGAFTREDIRLYREALARPGVLTAALNYYRAALRHNPYPRGRPIPPVRVPTLLLWGERDAYLSPALTRDLGDWVPDLRVERLPEVSHWVQNDAPERVSQCLIEFLRGM